MVYACDKINISLAFFSNRKDNEIDTFEMSMIESQKQKKKFFSMILRLNWKNLVLTEFRNKIKIYSQKITGAWMAVS